MKAKSKLERLLNKLGWFKCEHCRKYVHSVECFGAIDAYGAICKHCGTEQGIE